MYCWVFLFGTDEWIYIIRRRWCGESFFIYIDLISLLSIGINLSVYAFVNSAIGEKNYSRIWYWDSSCCLLLHWLNWNARDLLLDLIYCFHLSHLWLCLCSSVKFSKFKFELQKKTKSITIFSPFFKKSSQQTSTVLEAKMPLF